MQFPRTETIRFNQTNLQVRTMSYLRTPEHRKRKAELIRQWKPWEQSTGPRTEEGKAASAGNSRKHGMRSREWLEQVREVKEYLRQCREREQESSSLRTICYPGNEAPLLERQA